MSPTRFEDVAKFMVVNPFARKLIAIADQRLGYSLVDRYRETEGDYSVYAQVAFLVNCLALAQWTEATSGVRPDILAGPSFGGKAAAVHSGALAFEDAVWMTSEFARCMDEYFAVEHSDIATHSFVRTPRALLDALLGELTEQGEWHEIACYVDDDFYMLSLREERIDWLDQRLRSAGGMPFYTMKPPMHCSVFEDLARKAEDEVLSKLDFADPSVPVVADQDGRVLRTAADIRSMLLDVFYRPVRWPEVVASLRRENVGKIVMSGQDSLFGRVPLTRANFEVVAVNPRLALQPQARRRRGAAA